MPTPHLLKNTFNRGELSPKAYSRVDLEMYGGGVERLRNFVPMPQGGAYRRSGTYFAGSAKSNTADATFYEFAFTSTGDAFVIEAGNNYFRFWKDYGQVVSAPNTPVEVTTTYSLAEAAELQMVQIGNVIYIAHPDHAPATLTRNTDTSWTLDDIDFVDGPYLPINDTTTSVTSSAGMGEGTTTTLTFSSVTGVNGGAGFQSTDVGRHIRVRGTDSTSIWCFGIIASVVDTTHITVNWIRAAQVVSNGSSLSSGQGTTTTGGACTNSKSWRLGAFSDTTGYPACVAFYESRLSWARTEEQPRGLFFSRVGLPLDYAPSNGDSTVVADHGFAIDILAGRADQILWLNEAPRLQVGTSSGIRTLGASDTGSAFSILNISQRLEVTFGAADTRPVRIGESSIYAGRFGLTLRHLTYSYEQNGLVAPDITVLHDHLFGADVKKIAVQENPEPIIWVLKTDGSLLGITFDSAQSVVAYHRHDFGEDAEVKSIAVIPGADRDELWLLMKRTINSSEKRYVEVLKPRFDIINGEIEDAFFVDCGVTYDGATTNTVSGLSHLEGEEVDVLADGAVKTGITVSGGSITVPGAGYEKIHVGLNMISELKTLRPPYQQGDGWILGRRQAIARLIVEVIRSGPVQFGTEEGTVNAIAYRRGNEDFGTPPGLRTGPYVVPVIDRFVGGGQAYAIMDTPLPAYIRSILIQLNTEDAEG